jgi:hypothetical protein
MVTQSAGPYTAVGMGMALAAWESRALPTEKRIAFLQEAARELANSRPTAANRYGQITFRAAELAEQALEAGRDPIEAIVESTVESLNRRYSTMQIVGNELAALIPEGGSILTQCFGETIIGTVIRAARESGKNFRVYCAETRPYLQGARLTSSCFAEMGFETTVLTDNMIAYAMQNEGIDLFTSALLLYDNGAVANLDCGMLLPEGRLDRFRIHGTLGTIVSPVEFNQCGEIPYTVIRNGVEETKTVTAPNNYALESEQLSLCVLGEAKPHVSKEFSLLTARVTDRILQAIGY